MAIKERKPFPVRSLFRFSSSSFARNNYSKIQSERPQSSFPERDLFLPKSRDLNRFFREKPTADSGAYDIHVLSSAPSIFIFSFSKVSTVKASECTGGVVRPRELLLIVYTLLVTLWSYPVPKLSDRERTVCPAFRPAECLGTRVPYAMLVRMCSTLHERACQRIEFRCNTRSSRKRKTRTNKKSRISLFSFPCRGPSLFSLLFVSFACNFLAFST